MANGQLVIVSSVVGHIVITLGGASEIDFFYSVTLVKWIFSNGGSSARNMIYFYRNVYKSTKLYLHLILSELGSTVELCTLNPHQGFDLDPLSAWRQPLEDPSLLLHHVQKFLNPPLFRTIIFLRKQRCLFHSCCILLIDNYGMFQKVWYTEILSKQCKI